MFTWLRQRGCLSLICAIAVWLSLACTPQPFPQISETALTSPVRVIHDAMGTVKVPIAPERVITLDGGGLENTLALGIQPVSTVLNGSLEQQFSFIRPHLEGVKPLGTIAQPSLEKILLSKPDLILTSSVSDQIYPQLTQIAPTVLAEFERSGRWENSFKLHAAALRKSPEADELINHYHQRLTTFRQQMGDRLKTLRVSIVRIYPDSISLYQRGSFAGNILAEAGLQRPPSQQGKDVQRHISQEMLQLADGDVIFLWDYDNETHWQSQQTLLERLQADPLWLSLTAVQRHKVYVVPGYWIGFGPLAASHVVDDLFKYLIQEE
jgi:iron complex transport system substrate-binding protein